MEIMDWLPALLLLFCRITAFFISTPIFGRNVPSQVKIGFSAFLSIVTWMTLPDTSSVHFDTIYIAMIIREIIVGLVLGYITSLFFAVFQISGSFIDMQMGLGIASVLDPVSGIQAPLMGNFKYLMALMVFFSINGHHLLMRGLILSYKWIPLSGQGLIHMVDGQVSNFLLQSLGIVFMLSFQLASPFVAVMFLIDLSLGILTKTAPQMNIFVIGVPIKILVGFMMFIVLIPGFLYLFEMLFQRMLGSLDDLMRIVGV